MAGVSLYWHTVRYLSPAQILSRLRFHFTYPTLARDDTPAQRPLAGPWTPHATRPTSMLAPARFRFLNEEHEASGPPAWNDPAREKLWLYNLHYFDDLAAADATSRARWHQALIARWIEENPPTAGNGWEPYPTSLRVVNWIKWVAAGAEAPAGFDRSLGLQVRWLSQRIEYHLQANHLFVNAKALLMAGVWYDGAEAAQWRHTGDRILTRELERQLLGDGAHYERSPMYHALLIEDLLDMINLARAAPGIVSSTLLSTMTDAAPRMLGWLSAMTHPDGDVAFFNDSATGIAPSSEALHAYAARLGLVPGLAEPALGHSGYCRVDAADAVLIVDAAQVGPDEQPGHAHADTLSFELSLYGERALVNTGTSTYRMGPRRSEERATAAHNTVGIGTFDSSEVWGSFRVARRARVRDAAVVRRQDVTEISAAHTGYARLPGRPVHRRVWQLSERRLAVVDEIHGATTLPVTAYFHWHPEVRLEPDGRAVLQGGRVARWAVDGGDTRIVPTMWSPQFGLRVPNQCLEVRLWDSRMEFRLEW